MDTNKSAVLSACRAIVEASWKYKTYLNKETERSIIGIDPSRVAFSLSREEQDAFLEGVNKNSYLREIVKEKACNADPAFQIEMVFANIKKRLSNREDARRSKQKKEEREKQQSTEFLHKELQKYALWVLMQNKNKIVAKTSFHLYSVRASNRKKALNIILSKQSDLGA